VRAIIGNRTRLNETFVAKGLAPAQSRPTHKDVEDDDLLQMVSAGILCYAIVDHYAAHLWAKILPGLRSPDDLALRDDGAIVWALRKSLPLLQREVAACVAHKSDTSFGATVMPRYFTGPKALSD
jgi:membrane-bound lytic murein transglycosylase MltF